MRGVVVSKEHRIAAKRKNHDGFDHGGPIGNQGERIFVDLFATQLGAASALSTA